MTLDQYLRAHGITGKELAERIGVTEASLSRIRRGEQNISRDTIRLIVETTGGAVTADDLVFHPVHVAPDTTTEQRDHG